MKTYGLERPRLLAGEFVVWCPNYPISFQIPLFARAATRRDRLRLEHQTSTEKNSVRFEYFRFDDRQTFMYQSLL